MSGSKKRQVNPGLVAAHLHRDAVTLCAGRHDLPLRVMTARVKGRALMIDKLLNYKQHVAVLGLMAVGMHRHAATLLVVTGNAGACEGSLKQFGARVERHKLKFDDAVATILPDGVPWTIWWKNRTPRSSVIPVVNGWGPGFIDVDETLTSNLADLITNQ